MLWMSLQAKNRVVWYERCREGKVVPIIGDDERIVLIPSKLLDEKDVFGNGSRRCTAKAHQPDKFLHQPSIQVFLFAF